MKGLSGEALMRVLKRKRRRPKIVYIVLTKGERAALQMMIDKDEELVEFVPGGWWIDTHEVSGRIGKSLLQKCLISEDQYSSEVAHHYYINEWGRKTLNGDKVYIG